MAQVRSSHGMVTADPLFATPHRNIVAMIVRHCCHLEIRESTQASVLAMSDMQPSYYRANISNREKTLFVGLFHPVSVPASLDLYHVTTIKLNQQHSISIKEYCHVSAKV